MQTGLLTRQIRAAEATWYPGQSRKGLCRSGWRSKTGGEAHPARTEDVEAVISRARVTQVMNLLRLPSKIQVGLMRPPFPLEIHSFSERSLRVLVSCGDEEAQTARWRELVQNLRGSAGNW